MTSKYQIEINSFRNIFSNIKNRRIVIYGIGRRTVTLLPGIVDFNVVGLLDREPCNQGKMISKIPIISLTEAEHQADVIIINSDPTNFYTIYQRIAETKLPVYYANGEKACLKTHSYEKNPYWQETYETFIKTIDQYDIISFDFFDTLIIRKITSPTDVFRLLDKRKNEINVIDIDVFSLRQLAAGSENEKDTLAEIYEEIASRGGISPKEAHRLMELELSIEYEVCVPRPRVLQALQYAITMGKKVYITSDTYLTFPQMAPLLSKCGLEDFPQSQIILSSEVRLYKRDGNIWCLFDGMKKGNRILHVGDDVVADISIPRQYGIDTYHVMSGKQLLEASSLAELLPKAISLSDSVHLGLVIVKLFSDPFVLSERNGKVFFQSAKSFGYVVLGGVLTRFLMWLYRKQQQYKYKKLLFFARDGYFLIRDFEYLLGILNQKQGNSAEVLVQYVPVSRRLLYLATMQTEEDYWKVASFPYFGTFADYLKSRFNVEPIDVTSEINDIEINATNDTKQLMQWLEYYREAIWEEAGREKAGYEAFLKEEGLFTGNCEATIDFSFYGTNQYYFQKLMKRNYDGYYFFACYSTENEYKKCCAMLGCFNSQEDPEALNSYVKKKSAFLESFLSAPYGMIRYVNADGRLICEPDKQNQKHFSIKEEVNEGIQEYMKEFISIYGLDGRAGYESLEAFTYYTALNGNIEVSRAISKGFYFDNDMVGGKEVLLEI